jgi:hypothetical protein
MGLEAGAPAVMDKTKFYVVHIGSGSPYAGTLPPARDRHALIVALAEMLEGVSYWRGKLEVRP